jgi:hypothetical protein
MLRSFSMTLADTSVAVTVAALLTPATGMAAAAGATDSRAVDTYTGLSCTVPAGLDDQGRPQTCVIDTDLYKPHTASTANRVPAWSFHAVGTRRFRRA